MRLVLSLGLAVAGLMVGSAQVWAATCDAGRLTCPTQMPIGGYCECTARGNTESGTVVARPAPRRPATNSTAGGCGANPNAPGCRS